jgi:hypothetical protein
LARAQETKVLQTIDRLKTKASHEWKLDRQYRMMHLMALPKKYVAQHSSQRAEALFCREP